VVVLLAIFGNALWITGHAGAYALAAMLFALAALVYQLVILHHYWMVIPKSATSPESAEEVES